MVNELEVSDPFSKLIDAIHDIPELDQHNREYLATLEKIDTDGYAWFYPWQEQHITEELANKFLLHRTELLGQLVMVIRPVIELFKEIKIDFIKHITDLPESDSEEAFGLNGNQVIREAREFYDNRVIGALLKPEEYSQYDPMVIWMIREIGNFLGTLRLKKFLGVTKDMNIGAFGERFIFKDHKLAEHISPTFNFNVEDWVKEHELKEVYGATGKPTAEGLKLIAYRRYYFERDKQKVIAHDLGISQPSVAQWIDAIEYKIGYEMGHAFEDFFARVRAPLLFKSYKKLGGNGEPDGIGELEDGEIEVVALKCYRQQSNSVTISRKELRPEIAETTKLVNAGKKAKLHLFFREHLRDYEEDRIVDVAKDEPETFSLPYPK